MEESDAEQQSPRPALILTEHSHFGAVGGALITFGLLSLPGLGPGVCLADRHQRCDVLTCRYDRAISPMGATRVPPVSARVDGDSDIGAIIAFPLFRTSALKAPFRWAWALCVIFSVNLVALYYVAICPECR
jgi:hypothetical protein